MNFTPKVNPRLRVIKQEEQKFTPSVNLGSQNDIVPIANRKLTPITIYLVSKISWNGENDMSARNSGNNDSDDAQSQFDDGSSQQLSQRSENIS